MPRCRWIALQGSSRGLLPPLLLFVSLITTSGIPALAADVSAACSSPFARIVSIQGTIELLRARQNDWSRVTHLDTSLCEGDRLRTGELSRAALFIQPETLVRVDQNTSISISQTADETLVEFTQESTQDGIVPASTTAHTCGAGYFITRFPRKFRVNTPHLNAAVEGTEFLVAMRCETTDLSVFEGKVLAISAGTNVFPSQSVVSGQTLTVGGSEPPAIKLLIKPVDAVQWTLYYPPLTPANAAVVENCSDVAQDNRASCLVARAERLLRAGRVDEAQANIGDALAVTPYSSDAKALSSIIRLVKNDKVDAMRLAKEAVEATPNSAPAWLALSYAQQADFKLEAALASARRASELTPSSALAFARVAELQLSLGWTREAEKSAQQAVAANPDESRAHIILGFVHLAQIKVKEAREDFGRAIELDSTEPLSRLGLGLAIIRKGNLVEGREQIEIAVALDPTNSLIRSYVGKAYYEENTKDRDKLASIQFDLAKGLDPNDPTPWFYDAILKQTLNRPVDALYDLQNTIELNDNRSVYRSRLLLDQDAASRNASLARIYGDLGFEQSALVESAKSLTDDPGNYSAHRFLADTYAVVPRHEIARSSELLQAQLRQPLGSSPLQAQLANDELFLLGGAGPANIGMNEFNPLFSRNGLQLQLYGLSGEQNTNAEQVIVNALTDRVALSASQFHFDTDGFRENNDNKKTIYDAFLQANISAGTSVQAEVSSSDQNFGDLIVNFDPNNFSVSTNETKIDNYRLGIRHELVPQSDLLISLIHTDRQDEKTLPGLGQIIKLSNVSTKIEAQNLFRASRFSLVTGIGYFRDKADGEFFSTPLPTSEPFQFNGYGYAFVPIPTANLTTQFGYSFDHLRSPDSGDQEQWNPKFGLIWTPTSSTTFRATTFKVLRRRINSDQGLEPTNVVGFNQYFDDINGASSRRTALALDQKLTPTLSMGMELSKRDIQSPLTNGTTIDFDTWKEKDALAYAYWTPDRWVALSVKAQWEHFDRPIGSTDEGFNSVYTWFFPVSLRLFIDNGLSANLTTTHVHQWGTFLDTFVTPFDAHETFSVTDLFLSYNLPRRSGLVTVGVQNIFDEGFRFQSTDGTGSRFSMERSAFARISLLF
jgi:Tfp pilus assembly protein PilF